MDEFNDTDEWERAAHWERVQAALQSVDEMTSGSRRAQSATSARETSGGPQKAACTASWRQRAPERLEGRDWAAEEKWVEWIIDQRGSPRS
jgi:hypothetical protein